MSAKNIKNDIHDENEVDEVTDDVTVEQDDTLDDSVLAEETAQEAVKKLRAKLKETTEEKQKYLDLWQRDKAEFMNARKRDKEDMERVRKFATENLVEDLIPALQNFDLAFSNKEVWEKVDKNWRTGVEYIYSQLLQTLKSNGLMEVSPLGEVFNPNRDESVGSEPVEKEADDHKILAVLQKGYSLNGKVIRAPKVKIGEYKSEQK